MRHLTCDPNVEVYGGGMQMFLLNLNAAEIAPYLEKHGLSNFQPDAWYPLERFLNVLNDLAATSNVMSNYVAIGMAATKVDIESFPPEMLERMSLEDILASFGDLYVQQFRGGDVGGISTERIADQHYQVIYREVPLPDHFLYGSVYAVARAFSKGSDFSVWYDTDIQRMDEGGTQTIIHVQWE